MVLLAYDYFIFVRLKVVKCILLLTTSKKLMKLMILPYFSDWIEKYSFVVLQRTHRLSQTPFRFDGASQLFEI